MAYKKLANGEIEVIPEKANWACMPKEVLWNKNLRQGAKNLYAEIVGLSETTQFAVATNAYYATVFDVQPRQITRWLAELEKEGYIYVRRIKETGGRKRRFIYPLCIPHKYEKYVSKMSMRKR